MNKKLIAAAIAAVVAAPAAVAADTTLYGKFHVSINNSDAPAGATWNVSSHSSRIGIKGAEDLGDGLKAIFKAEFGLSLDANAGLTGGRNSYIGLSGGWGTFLAGKHDTPAKVGFYAAGNERLGDSIIDLNSNFGFSELRANNAIAYISPNMNGVTVAAAIVPGETAGGPDGLADAYSLTAIYKGAGIKGSVGYTNADDLVLGTATLLNAGATYSFNDFSVGAQYQNVDRGTGDEDTAWALTGTAKFGSNKLILIYGNAEDDSKGQDYSTLGVAVQHIFSKRSSVYVAYRNAENPAGSWKSDNWIGNGGSTAKGDAFSLGMIHTF